MIDTISTTQARTLLLDRQGLLADPARPAGPAATQRVVEQLGYVQVDSINVAGRAHDLTLAARLDGYQPDQLTRLVERRRSLFEHWTHDASLLPSDFLAHWHPRFQRWKRYYENHAGWKRLGPDRQRIVRSVLRRIEREGPLLSRDFEQDRSGAPKRAGFWNWGHQKAALEYLWRTGRLVIPERRNFQKVYDLRERVFPDVRIRAIAPARHLDWACRESLARIGAGTAAEIAGFLGGHTAAEVDRWCKAALRRGDVEAVLLESADGSKPRPGFALPDWRERVDRAPAAPDRIRLLGPFDPVIRDRKRLKRLFGFDYKVEIFVPPRKRRFGYYVTPILEGDRLVGRLDPKFHRDRGVLEIKGTWWEPGVRPTRARKRALDEATWRIARLVGASDVEGPRA